MIDRLSGDLLRDLAWVLNWHGLDAATNRSDTDLAQLLLDEVDKLRVLSGDRVQLAVDEATANPGQTVIVGEHGPELSR